VTSHSTVTPRCCGAKNAIFSNRIIYTHPNWRFGVETKVNLSDFSLLKYNGFYSYNLNAHNQVTAEHISREDSDGKLKNDLILSSFKTCSNWKAAASLTLLNFNKKDLNYAVGLENAFNDHLHLKFRLDNFNKFAFGARYKVSDHIHLGVAGSFDVDKDGVSNIVGKNNFSLPLGFSVHFRS